MFNTHGYLPICPMAEIKFLSPACHHKKSPIKGCNVRPELQILLVTHSNNIKHETASVVASSLQFHTYRLIKN